MICQIKTYPFKLSPTVTPSYLFPSLHLHSNLAFKPKPNNKQSAIIIKSFNYQFQISNRTRMLTGIRDWQLIEAGPSFIKADLIFIKETLNTELSGNEYENVLTTKVNRISKILKYNIGKGEWQVFCIKGQHARKFVCSRNFFCIFQKKDGLRAYIWINRFKPEEETELTFQQ